MSGPKGIDYAIAQERRALEEARAQATGLVSRRAHILNRVQAHSLSDLVVPVPPRLGSTSADVSVANQRFSQELARLETEVSRRIDAKQHVTVGFDASVAVARLRRKEDEAREARRAAKAASSEVLQPASSPAHQFDIEAHRAAVVRRMESIEGPPNAEVAGWAESALAATAPADARMTLAELDSALDRSRRIAAQRTKNRAQLAELRGQVGSLLDPELPQRRLGDVETALESGVDVCSRLAELKRDVRQQFTEEEAERGRLAVLASVRGCLERIGYKAVDVELDTPDSLVLTPVGSRTHAVKVAVADGEVDIRTVRTGESVTAAEDRSADVALCSDLPEVLESLQRDGIDVGRVRRVPAGVVRPDAVAVDPRTTRKVSNAERIRRRRPQAREGGK